MTTTPSSTSIHDYDAGLRVTGSGPLLVYVPGIDGTGSLFYRQRPLLEAAGYRVATYRLRDSARDMDTLLDDLDQVLDAAGTEEPVTLIAESFGGTLSLSFALARPGRVDGLVILNSFPFFKPQVRLRLAVLAVSLFPWKTMEMVRRLTAFRLHSRHTHADEMRRFLELTKATTREGYVNRLRILKSYDIRQRLHDLETPTLFLAADQDHLVPSVKQADIMASLVPDAQVTVLPGHGHICLIAPDLDLAAHIQDWRGGA